MVKLSSKIVIYLVILCVRLQSLYGQSLARNKAITVSPLEDQNKWDKSCAVDGKYDRNASRCKCCADSGRGANPWIKIDLGEANSFTRIVVYGRTDFNNSADDIDILAVELDGKEVPVSPVSKSSDPYFFHISLEKTMSARNITLISKGDKKRLVLCEVDVFNDSIISTRKTIDTSYDSWKPSNAVDGLNRTCCTATEPQPNLWLKLDLGDTFFITLIQLYGRTDDIHSGQSFEGMRIDVDDVTIHRIPTSGTNIDYYELFPTPEKIGRYIKLTLTGDKPVFALCEMVVYGERVISMNKNADQSTRYYGWRASRAVDGKYITDKPQKCRCCSGTKHEENPWLEVDLGSNHKISRIVIYGRTDGNFDGQSFADMKIEIDSVTLETIPEPDPAYWIDFYGFQLSPVRVGKVVKLTLEGTYEQLVVCELLVYGDCMDGYFGKKCDQHCFCKGGPCNTLTGICPSGICEPGYKGDTCSEQCDAYRYGQNCTETCGECKNNVTCNFTSGFCEDCEDGYTLVDKTCKTNCSGKYMYGYNCSNICGKCRDNKPCDITNGQCDGCADGYKHADTLCKTMCDNGTYGYNCTEKCGKCRNNEVCDKVDGQCTGCEDGYTETDHTCKRKCPNGTYGQNCSNDCGSCKDSTPCNLFNGTCEDCSDGYYLTDKLCKTGCVSHTYGYNCTSRCGQCRDNLACDPVNGECIECEAGYNDTDPLCNTTCDGGFYGIGCKTACGHCFGEEICHRVDGSCSRCSEAFVGTTCSKRKSSSLAGPITGGIIGTIALVVLNIVVVFFLRKRRQPSRPPNNIARPEREKPATNEENAYHSNAVFDGAGLLHSDVNKTLKGAPEKADVENEYYNFTSTTPDILIHDLWEYILKNKVNRGEGFDVEFKKLKDGLIFPCNDALANREKNRYKQMYPYDHARVHLKVEMEGESEFINASHIDGFDEMRKFIASQGPITVMVDDFWRMVWQQNTTIIVMLTNLVEAGNQKCMQYWPDEGSVNFARITITMIQENDLSDYFVRTLEIQQDGGTPRRICQFHFKAWPDKDVPDSTWSLTQFWRDIFRDNDKNRGPIVVHCSAGVGRTGTFIALDNLYHQAVTTGRVTPFSVVEALRNQRVKMVQTSKQYMYLHEALADLLSFGTHYLWLSQFPEYYDFMIKKDKDKGKMRLRVQYEYLEKSLANGVSQDGDQAADANTVEEIEEYKPKSATSVDREPGKFCTVFLPGLNGPDSFILTTLPDGRSMRECSRLIDDHNVGTVITLTDDAKGSCNTALGNMSRASIKQVEVNFSCKHGAETPAETTLELLDLISTWQPHISTTQPVMIQCRDGVLNSGVLTVLLNEKLRMLEKGGQINILESVMMARRANKSCVSSFSQYKFIHDIMLQAVEKKVSVSAQEEIEDLDIYQNV